jgi:hypothetical protein
MQPKNPKVKAAVIQNAGTDTEQTETTAREARIAKAIQRAENAKRGVFTKAPDKIANDSFHARNYPIPKGKEMFPAEWKMHFVDLFYPYAQLEDGTPAPLFIDMPVTLHEVSLCERKIVAMREKGLRYTYIKPGETEFEAHCRLQGLDPEQIKKDQEATRRKEPRKGEASA